MENKQSIGIMGYGEVGQSLAEVYRETFFGQPLIKTLDKDELHDNMDVLNICIPLCDNFIDIVIKEIKRTNARLTIIHSTVPPYTTKEIRGRVNKDKEDKVAVVHSPIRGVHPDLARSIKTFRKYIGVENHRDAKMALEHFRLMGLKRTGIRKPAVITEINKLISTTYYGVCIAYTDYVQKVLEKYKVDFETFEKFNESYNKGYRRMRMRKVCRPTLYPPQGKISGHCITQNAKLLQKCLDHKLIQSLLEVGQEDSENL